MMVWELFALAVLLGFIIGFLIGAFLQWDEHQPILRKNRQELMDSYKEQERLRMKIYEMQNLLPIRQSKGK